MAFKTSPDPLKHEHAIGWFRKRVPLTGAQKKTADDDAKARAFTVAGVAKLDVLHDVWTAIDAALSDGTTLEDFKASAGERLHDAWAGTVANPGARIETIFRTNVQTA